VGYSHLARQGDCEGANIVGLVGKNSGECGGCRRGNVFSDPRALRSIIEVK
jgi:hypothetical protein